ncbi:MAG: TIGR04219 family outer membrane beta-barrel protein [Hahellaceae bacterium]|nr:TIGR04219 family outer membrane beta-barrel protein [Hahellaceae bacterium]
MNKMTSWIAASTLTLCAPFALADVIGASAGMSYWIPDTSGTVKSGGSEIDLEKNLGLKDQENMVFFVTLEHPLPLLPNAKFQYFDMDQVSYGNINTSFNGVNFSGNVQTSLDLTHYEFILYYEVLDNIIDLDVGINAKLFDGELFIRQTTNNSNVGNTSRTEINEIVPMLYANAGASLPFTGLSAGVEASAISYGDALAYDVAAKVRQRITVIAFELGYRAMKVDIEDISNVDVNIDVAGPYVSAMVVF